MQIRLTFQSFLGSFDLAESRLVRLEEETIHVGKFNFVVIEEKKFSDSTSRQHFSRHAPNAANTNNSDTALIELCKFIHICDLRVHQNHFIH